MVHLVPGRARFAGVRDIGKLSDYKKLKIIGRPQFNFCMTREAAGTVDMGSPMNYLMPGYYVIGVIGIIG